MEGVMYFNRADRESGDPIAPAAVFRTGKKVPPDAISLLKEDHRNVLGWFDWYEMEEDPQRKEKIVSMIIRALQAHMAIEEEIFYPQAAEATGEEALIKHAIKEHEAAKKLIGQAADNPLHAEDPMRKLHEDVKKHVEEEERDLLPKVRESDLDLYAVGRSVAARRIEALHQLLRGMPLSLDPGGSSFTNAETDNSSSSTKARRG